jgi:hypothetical protein
VPPHLTAEPVSGYKLMGGERAAAPDLLVSGATLGMELRMNEAFRTLVAAAIASTAGGAMCFAQSPPAVDIGPRPPVARPQVTGPAISGSWSGTALRIQRSVEYSVILEITARAAEVNYPDFHCGGKLSRVGVSREYAFFIETITRGTGDYDVRCSNGSVTMARAGDDLVWAWFGLVKGEVVTAYGKLSRQPDANQQTPAGEEGQSVTATPAPISPPPVRKPRPLPVRPASPVTNGAPQ